MTQYWRVTFVAANGRKRHVWARDYNDPGAGGLIRFTVVNHEGDESDPREVVFASPKDVTRLKVAVMNKTYAMLEIKATDNSADYDDSGPRTGA